MTKEWSKEVFSRNLRRYMELSGKNQKELSEIIGVSPTAFNRWLSCDLYPRIDKIQKLADYFGIAKSDLIEDKSQVGDTEKVDLHVRILKDNEVLDLIEVYYELNDESKKALRLMAHALKNKS
jgi:transcriptional regulator with XRE-family HTH domain